MRPRLGRVRRDLIWKHAPSLCEQEQYKGRCLFSSSLIWYNLSALAQPPQAMSSHPGVPLFMGYVETTTNALRLIHAARQGVIPCITRRLNDSERRTMIKSGAVFVFSVKESGIQRWTGEITFIGSKHSNLQCRWSVVVAVARCRKLFGGVTDTIICGNMLTADGTIVRCIVESTNERAFVVVTRNHILSIPHSADHPRAESFPIRPQSSSMDHIRCSRMILVIKARSS
jgi:hypothetical protein